MQPGFRISAYSKGKLPKARALAISGASKSGGPVIIYVSTGKDKAGGGKVGHQQLILFVCAFQCHAVSRDCLVTGWQGMPFGHGKHAHEQQEVAVVWLGILFLAMARGPSCRASFWQDTLWWIRWAVACAICLGSLLVWGNVCWPASC